MGNHVGTTERVIVLVVIVLTGVLIVKFDLPDKWLTAVFCTVPTFAGMFDYFHRRMPRNVLWKTMLVMFAFHIALLFLVFGIVLRNLVDVGFLVCVPMIFLEGIVLYHGAKFFQRKVFA